MATTTDVARSAGVSVATAQPGKEIGARAVRLLLGRLAEPDRPAQGVRLPCTFVHRTLCGCPDPSQAPPERGTRS